MKLNKTFETLKIFIAHSLLLIITNCAFAQDYQNELVVVNEITIHKQQVAQNNTLRMLELNRIVPHIKIELLYASVNNFTHVRMYPKNTKRTYLRKDVANALVAVANELGHLGLGIKVWDAYRPYSVTKKFWELIHDDRYVANPSKGSGHNRGIAIDMTLYDLTSEADMDMPSGFDDFSDAAHHGYMKLDSTKIKNRELLKDVMQRHGFNSFATEWWHYSWPNSNSFPILDIPINKIGK